MYKIRLKVGDMVVVRTGKDKGKTGKVVAVHPSLNKVTVEGVNIAKKHIKPNRTHPQGDIVQITRPIWVSKVAIMEPTSKKPSKIAFKVDAKGVKTRVYKRNGKIIALVSKAKEGSK